ncbi:MAG: OsmC family protein [Dehalococcoidia bacterium]
MTKVCDCFPELAAVTAEREQRYRQDPEAARSELTVTVTSVGNLNELVECQRSGHKFIISEPAHVGGQNIAPWPLEYLLGGAVGCFAAVFAFYAAKLGISYDRFQAAVKTTLDARGHMIPEAPPSGFQGVALEINVVSDEPQQRLDEVLQLALKWCPGISTLRDPMPIAASLRVESAAATGSR